MQRDLGVFQCVLSSNLNDFGRLFTNDGKWHMRICWNVDKLRRHYIVKRFSWTLLLFLLLLFYGLDIASWKQGRRSSNDSMLVRVFDEGRL